MEALRTTIDSERLTAILDLPEGLRNREVEVIVLPIERKHDSKPTDDRSALRELKGSLHEYVNTELRKREKSAWPRAAAAKHRRLLKEMEEDDRS